MTERLSINTLNPNSPQCVRESLEDRPDASAPPTFQEASGLCQSNFLRTCPDCPVTAEEMWKNPSRDTAHHRHRHPPCKASVLLRESLRPLRCPWRRPACVLRGKKKEKLDLPHQKWRSRASLITNSRGFSLQIPFRPPHPPHPSGLPVLLTLPASSFPFPSSSVAFLFPTLCNFHMRVRSFCVK